MLISSLVSKSYRAQLVAALQQRGAITSSLVAQAFATIPRERFVQTFYEQEGRAWTPRSEKIQGEQWLSLIYQDQSLVTRLNTQNIPISSSSMPSVTASMLEALDVKPGQRVLEIGTGTGYNAALLAALTGDSTCITTIELDAEMAEQAARILQDIVGPVRVEVRDGNLGAPEHAPFERIVATASSSSLPRAWYEQLTPGGRLVMPLQGSLQIGGFLVIQRDEEKGIGLFRQSFLYFMAMRSGEEETVPATNLFQQPVAEEIHVEADDPLLVALKEEKFRWFIQWWWPSSGNIQINMMKLHDGRQAYLLKDPTQLTILQLTHQASGCCIGKQRGAFPLWTMIQKAYGVYRGLGEPGQEAFQVSIENQRASLLVTLDGHAICLRDLFGK